MPIHRKRGLEKLPFFSLSQNSTLKPRAEKLPLFPLKNLAQRLDTSSLFVGLLAWAMAILTATDSSSAQWLERQTQTLLQRLKPGVAPPSEIVIVAIDDYSLSQGERYLKTPRELPDFKLLERWPWRREAYALVTERLMQAGAKAVALDVFLDLPSVYGPEDDGKLRQVLERYPGRIVLAAQYEQEQLRPGDAIELSQPHPGLQGAGAGVGSTNFPLEADGRIHRFASQFPMVWAKKNPDLAQTFLDFVATVPSFSQATLQAADANSVPPKGDRIFFYGPNNTFEQISFADLLDAENWNSYLQGGEYFRDKIVLVGATSPLFKDLHPTPMSSAMPGVEVQANELATILQNRALVELLPSGPAKGFSVFVLTLGVGLLACRRKSWPMRALATTAAAIAWSATCYTFYVGSHQILPMAVPLVGILLAGSGTTVLGAAEELLRKRRLRETMKYYASSPIVQEIISQQEDWQDLLEERNREILTAVLGGRYQVLQDLGSGGFGKTYIALDLQRPGTPKCVIKQLRPAREHLKHWNIAKRLLCKEAEILEKLGHHEQIPQLLAYFEEGDEFYLVEEFVDGHLLAREFAPDLPLSESHVVSILRDILEILAFVHANGVIHRDLKPENIIRRRGDGKLVLIDFGAVKEVGAQLGETDEEGNKTVAIGSRGYAPPEQSFGQPKFNSDLYAAGMLALRALTLTHPAKLNEDPETGEIVWEDRAQVSPALSQVLNKMIRSDFRDRYQSAAEVLDDLQPLIDQLLDPRDTTACEVWGDTSTRATRTSLLGKTSESPTVNFDAEAETIALSD